MLGRQTISIPEKLRAFVRHVGVVGPGGSGGSSTGNLLSVYADGCPGLIFQYSEKGLLLNQNVRKTELAPVFLYGQTVAPLDMHSSGPLGMIVVSFHPYALRSLFRVSVKELTDDCLDLSLLSAVEGRLLRERLRDAGEAGERVRVIFDYLGQVVDRNRAVAEEGMVHATSLLLQSNGMMPLAALQRVLNVSSRTFERRFEQYIGISPKLFSRISQFQAALRHLQSGKFEKLSDVAYMCGYADQSHFIRNFSRFTGLSPLRWLRQGGG